MSESNGERERGKTAEFSEEQVIEWLKDPQKKELLIKKLGVDDPETPRSKNNTGAPIDKGSDGGKDSAGVGSTQHLTPSGKYAGDWAMPLPFFGWPWMAPFSGTPQPANYPPFLGGGDQDQNTSSSVSGNPGPSGLTTQTAQSEEESEPEDDVVQLLDQAEALEQL